MISRWRAPNSILRLDQMIVVGPTNDAQTLVIVYWPIAAFHEVRTDIETHFLAALDRVPELADLRCGCDPGSVNHCLRCGATARLQGAGAP